MEVTKIKHSSFTLQRRRNFGYNVSVRPSVRTLRVVESENEFLPSPIEFCRLLFQKALEVIANQNLSTEQILGVF